MAVPDFQSLMLPLLQVAADGKEHSLAQARDKLAAQFKLTSEDLAELLPSGKSSKFSNRVAWAKGMRHPIRLPEAPALRKREPAGLSV